MGGAMSSLFDCTTKEECEEFCSNRRNENELMCIQLRMVTGEITQEEAERIMEKEILQKGPGGPGGCRTIKECEEFCKKPGNMEECMRFTTGGRMATVGVQAVPAQIQVGPGGCRTLEECQEFCSKPENEQECMGPQGSDGMIGSGQGEQWTFEDEERIKQALQKEYGDEWQKVYDEKMRQRIEGMPPPGAWEGQQGTEVYMSPQEEEWQQQTKEEYMQRYGDEWEKRYNEEFEGQYLGDLQPERFMGSEGEGEVFRYTPGGVNQIILDVEQGFRDGVSLETELRFKPEGDTGGEWTIEGQTEQFYPQPESQPWPQEPIEGEWQEPKQDEWIDTSDGGASESWGEFEVYKEPIIEGGDWDVVEGDPGQWTDTTSAPMPTVDEPVYNIMPVPTYIEPAPMPTVDEPIYNIMPEPTYNEPAPEPSQGLLQPFRKFLGSVVESLAD